MVERGHIQANLGRGKGTRLALAILRLGPVFLQLGILVSAAFAIVCLASAEVEFDRDTIPAVRHAARIGSSEYWQRLADLDPNHATDALREAARADPLNASLWIALGLAEERAHNVAAAQREFERSFVVDRQYAPAWALANFCVRHEDADCFWRAAARAALRSPSLADLAIADSGGQTAGTSANLTDLAPLLDLASRMEGAPVKALDRLTASVNRFATADGATASYARSIGKELEKAWLNDLIGQERWDDATAIAGRIEARHDASDKPRLDDFFDRLITAGKASDAVETWNGYTGFTPLAPAKDVLITNGDFSTKPSESGFDWRIGDGQYGFDAHYIEKRWQPGLMEFRLSGEQPEQIELAKQWVAIAPRTYRLRFEYSTRGIGAPSGLRWEFASGANERDRHADSDPLAPSAEWRVGQWIFSNAGALPLTLARLRLIYIREPGSGRARGLLSLRKVSLERL